MVTPYNPCGAAVEWGRRSYRTRCRFFKDSDHESEIVWYPALPNAPVLPYPSAICSLDWDREEAELGCFAGYDVGEVPLAPRTFEYIRPKPAAKGTHQCGTREDFEDGAVYSPDLPVVPYRPDGLPACCVDGGGLGLGGYVPIDKLGGVALGGNASPPMSNTSLFPLAVNLPVGEWVTHAARVGVGISGTDGGFWYTGVLPAGSYTLEIADYSGPPSLAFVRVSSTTPGGSTDYTDFVYTSPGSVSIPVSAGHGIAVAFNPAYYFSFLGFQTAYYRLRVT